MSNYATKKRIRLLGVDTFNVPTSLNNFKTRLDDLDVGKLKTVPVDLKKLSDAADNEVVKNAKFNTRKAKVNNLEKKLREVGEVANKIPDHAKHILLKNLTR